MTCSEVGAVVGFPDSVGGQREAWVRPWGREAPASLEQGRAEKAAEEKRSEASGALEG